MTRIRRMVGRAVVAVGIVVLQIATCGTSGQPTMRALDEDRFPRMTEELAARAVAEPPSSIEEMRAEIEAVLKREGVPGVGLALVGRDGPIWVGGVGVESLETKKPIDRDTVFRVASVTKGFVGLGVMKLVERGKLQLDRPIGDVVPDAGIVNAWEKEAPVTLAQVIEHTAGLDDMRFNETFVRDDVMTASAALKLNPRSRRVRWKPGSRMAYSNVGYTLAARAIEVASGEPFDVWLEREVLEPLGMHDADFRRTEKLSARLATGYDFRDHAAPFLPIAHRPAGALLSSPAEMAKFVHFWIRRGEGYPSIVSEAGLARIERSGTLGFPHMDTEYGLGNYGDVDLPAKGRGHNGGLPGFLSDVRYFSDLGVGYAILFNQTFSFRAYMEVRAIVFAYLVRGQRLEVPATSATSAPAARYYAYRNPRHALLGFFDTSLLGLEVERLEQGALALHTLIGDESMNLVPTTDGGYRMPFQSGTSVRFLTGPEGKPIMVTPFMYGEAEAYWPARVWVEVVTIGFKLLMLAPWLAVLAFVIAAFVGRRVEAPDLVVFPALAGISCMAFQKLFFVAAIAGTLGEANAATVGIFVSTIVFALASGAAFASALRCNFGRRRPPLLGRIVPTLTSIAAFVLTIWVGWNGLVGLRTWAW